MTDTTDLAVLVVRLLEERAEIPAMAMILMEETQLDMVARVAAQGLFPMENLMILVPVGMDTKA